MHLINFKSSLTHFGYISYNVTECFLEGDKNMFPLPIIGVALASRILLSQKNKGQNFPTRPNIVRPSFIPPNRNPIEMFFRGLNRQLSTSFSRQPHENLNAIAKSFLPEGADILTPKSPLNSEKISVGDIDGDLKNELIVSYRLKDEIKTIILKKENDNWFKAGEIVDSGYESINYRSIIDFTGEGKNQLLVALSSKDKNGVLRCYTVENDSIKEIFNTNYHRLQVLKGSSNNRENSKSKLALWEKAENDTYNIQLLQWNGSQLEPADGINTYYSDNVVPYCLKKVRKASKSPQNWYNLADALVKAGLKKDALIASEAGIQYDSKGEFKERFEELINKISNE